MAAWRYRVAKDDKGKLHFVFARYDTTDPYARCGLIAGIAFNEGNSIDEMRDLARMLMQACDEPAISMAEFEIEPHDNDEEDE